MKRAFSSLLALSLCFALLAGCRSGGLSADKKDKVYELTFSIHDPADSVRTRYYEQLADKTREATGGKVEITVVPDGALLASTDVAEGVQAGTADMGWLLTTLFPDQFPLTEAVTLPMLFEDSYAATQVLLDLYEQSPELQNELKNYKVLGMYTNPINMLFTNTKVEQVADLEGMHIRATTGVAADILTAWGASPLLMGPEEIYQSMELNILQGMVFEWSGFDVYHLSEMAGYCVDLPITCGVFLTVMNRESYNALPAEYQAVIDEIWGARDVSLELAQSFLEDAAAARARNVRENDVTVIRLTWQATAEFQDVADDYIDAWVGRMTTDRFDAEAYLALLLALKEQYE